MKSSMGICLLTLAIVSVVTARQDPAKPVLREGISVQMPVSNQAIEMRDADDENATVVTVTADGKLFVGIRAVDLAGLAELKAETVYVKADARLPYQQILAVLDALRGHGVILLTAPASNGQTTTIMPPYGIKVALGR